MEILGNNEINNIIMNYIQTDKSLSHIILTVMIFLISLHKKVINF